ncbi:MAG: hypothetical protein LAT68_06035 [Cyclobacteriaceae bacterium]|nr:hypothetical protein [Cyclobacteriaceae bacterium]MCH8515871.1 hypothetical protein [Cyclobacteriaceae bacterium]
MLIFLYSPINIQLLSGFLFEFFILLNFILSLGLGFLTLIPSEHQGYASDGKKLLNTIKGGTASRVDNIIFHYFSLVTSGTRPALIDPHPLEELLQLELQTDNLAYIHGFLYNHYEDISMLTKAVFHLEEALKHMDTLPEVGKDGVWLTMALFEAKHKDNADKAREHRNKMKNTDLIPKYALLMLESAIAVAEAKHKLAFENAKRALIELPNSMDKGGAIADKEWLEKVIETYKESV